MTSPCRSRRLGPILTGLAGLLLATASFAQVSAVLSVNDQRLQGAGPGGRILVYAPDPVVGGSSVSHWDTSATPNLLMEPAINADLAFLGLDVTPSMMQDIGWSPGVSTFNIINLDPPDVGFTDPRPFAGAPGNPATTLGEARINLFNAVLTAWANALQSPITIDVEVTWQPLPCTAGAGAVLAGASTILIFSGDFPMPDTWYHSALAEALAGENLSGDDGDLFVILNSDIDEECLAPGTGYYYGLDGQDPNNQIDLAPVVLHEVGHGLGFANFTDETDGELVNGLPGIYDHFLFDLLLGKTWAEMTDAERVASAVHFRRLVWIGPQATAAAPDFLDTGVAELDVTSPAALAGAYEIVPAQFGPPITQTGVSGEIACMKDGTGLGAGDTPLDGCSAATNPAELAGKIALVDRGLCNFTDKVLNAQAAGATAVIVVNDVNDAAMPLTGDTSLPINVPTVGLGRSDGSLLRDAVCAADDSVLLNDGRFQVTALWVTGSGQSGAGAGAQLTDDTGYFSFFNADNVELVVKVLDACGLPGFNNFWVFVAGLTDVEVTLTVTDTETGEIKKYFNPLGQPFQPIQDTSAFDTCP